jgi:uncharacterized protein (TIGR03083 family)
MATSLNIEQHLAALHRRGHELADLAATAGYSAAVPTCPTWTVAHLVAHQAMVHRWAAAHVGGTDPDAVPNQTDLRARAELATYYREGVDLVVSALREAPDDLAAMTFLNDAPAPRRFWARRQAPETTVHGVDALAARLGRLPTAAEARIETALAIDGLDELLRGFFTRGASKLYDGDEFIIAVVPDDDPTCFVLHVGQQLTVAPPGTAAPADARLRLRGTADALYLALWNRGTDVIVDGDGEMLAHWHAVQRVRWS